MAINRITNDGRPDRRSEPRTRKGRPRAMGAGYDRVPPRLRVKLGKMRKESGTEEHVYLDPMAEFDEGVLG